MNKLTICIDFDGVLNNYKGYQENELYTPRDGAKEFIDTLSETYYIVIFTARPTDQVREWLEKYDFKYDNVTDIKVPAVVYIDDRAIPFYGDYDNIIKELNVFKPYWEKEPVYEYLECDDMTEDGICAGDMDYCSNLRTRCKKADDFYFKQDGKHYYQRFVIYKRYERIDGKLTEQYELRDYEMEFEPVLLRDKESAFSLIEYLYKLVDEVEKAGIK